MPGTNAGTGQPIHFVCSACRKRRGRWRDTPCHVATGGALSVHLSGHIRDLQSRGNAGGRNSRWAWKYVCHVCGHEGYSRHIDLEQQAKKNNIFYALELDKK